MNTWFTSDWHLGEDRFGIMQRPFGSVDDHCDLIIRNFNKVVKPDDLVYVLGDALYQKADPNKFLPLIGEMNGKKILIRGNHDVPFTDEQFKPYFEEIHKDGSGVQLDVGGVKCYLTHYPSAGSKELFNLVGHVHGAWKCQLNSLNVGIDACHFFPMASETVAFYFKAISEYYDTDVFAAYNPINDSFKEKRGKKSSYLKK